MPPEYEGPRWKTCGCEECKKAREFYEKWPDKFEGGVEAANELHKRWFSSTSKQREFYKKEYAYAQDLKSETKAVGGQ